ncbi:hypothetical protein CPIN18021_0296 [Campylobacter pinnipediorum subsp. caledonicus]|uniref:Uncharacterized protein n=1 Tax=Campylobacter pinnipediorum subsp. caledonicus TaxID=1874362 RepID=A0A1S6U616_9BACT|nr:hypothetical protein [Campylobacter pinnipediorum]AQW87143.1 hypothetical protein CPIN18021_0296 [Campylobacter pinnipediorum subsp. caledonicus]
MAFYNPKVVDFNPSRMRIEATGDIGGGLWDIYKHNVAKNQTQMKLDEDKRHNVASEDLSNKTLQETITDNAFDRDFKQNKFNVENDHWNKDYALKQDEFANTKDYRDKSLWTRWNEFKANKDIAYAKMFADQQEKQEKINTENILANSQADWLNKEVPDVAKTLGISQEGLSKTRERLKQQGYTDDQINGAVNTLVKTQIASLGTGFNTNPYEYIRKIKESNAQAQQDEANFSAVKSYVLGNKRARNALSAKYGAPIENLDPQTLDNYIRLESTGKGGLFNRNNIIASSKNAKAMATNLTALKELGTIVGMIEKGASNHTGFFGANKPINAIKQFLNSDDIEATALKNKLNALYTRFAKGARSDKVAEAMDRILPKFGDPSTNNFLSSLAVLSGELNSELQSMAKTLPNGTYSDDFQAELDNIPAILTRIKDLTGIDPVTMENTKSEHKKTKSQIKNIKRY